MPVLVAYGGGQGTTRGIADRVAEVLRAAGQVVDVRPVGTVGDLSGYDAFVVGGAVHRGRWHPEVVAFLRAHAHELVYRPVWLFSTGPAGDGTGDEARDGGDARRRRTSRRSPRPSGRATTTPSRQPWRPMPSAPTTRPRRVEDWAREIARDVAAPSPGL